MIKTSLRDGVPLWERADFAISPVIIVRQEVVAESISHLPS